jgi:hypothetical protein
MVLAIVFQTFASAGNPEKLRHAMRQMSREEFHSLVLILPVL